MKYMEYTYFYESPIGYLLIRIKNNALVELSFVEDNKSNFTTNKKDENEILCRVIHWLDIYFKKEQPQINIPFSFERGTAFQKCVWEVLANIPYGTSWSYKDVSKKVMEKMGKLNMSCQAIGQAVSKNPIAIIIPCHRVIGSNKEITGYAGGIERKEFLLKLENIEYTNKFK